MNINDLTFGEMKEIAAIFNNSNSTRIDAHLVGKPVIIRTYSAGVHIGLLQERQGAEVRLSPTRRLWKWRGAFTLSTVASKGISEATMPDATNEIILTECIEIIPMTLVAYTQLMELDSHDD